MCTYHKILFDVCFDDCWHCLATTTPPFLHLHYVPFSSPLYACSTHSIFYLYVYEILYFAYVLAGYWLTVVLLLLLIKIGSKTIFAICCFDANAIWSCEWNSEFVTYLLAITKLEFFSTKKKNIFFLVVVIIIIIVFKWIFFFLHKSSDHSNI